MLQSMFYTYVVVQRLNLTVVKVDAWLEMLILYSTSFLLNHTKALQKDRLSQQVK